MALAKERPDSLAEELQEVCVYVCVWCVICCMHNSLALCASQATKEDLVDQVKSTRKQVADMQNYIDVLLLRVSVLTSSLAFVNTHMHRHVPMFSPHLCLW